MLLKYVTSGINNLPFRGVIQFMVINQGVAFGLKLIAIKGQIGKYVNSRFLACALIKARPPWRRGIQGD
jgi:hypothetical protein